MYLCMCGLASQFLHSKAMLLFVGSWKALGPMFLENHDNFWARKAVVVYIQVRGYNSFEDNMTNLLVSVN